MSNFIEYNNKIAFHPGYYIKEIIDESGLSQKDFAKRLDTTPKNLSILVRGEQSLSIDIAMKLSRMLGTSVEYWLNLQKSYDVLIAEFESDKELKQERRIFQYFQYMYFREHFNLPDLPRKTDEQIKELVEKYNDYTVALQEAKIEQQEALKDFYDKQYDAVVSKVEEYKKNTESSNSTRNEVIIFSLRRK